MTRRTRTALTGGVLILALLAMGAGFPSQKVTPKQWATGVCTAVDTWVTSAKDGAAGVTAALQGSNPQLSDVRNVLVSYLGATTDATTQVIDDLQAAGTPATPRGKQAAAGLVRAFKKIRVSLRKLQGQADDISIQNQVIALAEIKALNRRVGREFNSFGASFKALKRLDPGHKLDRAFTASRACAAL